MTFNRFLRRLHLYLALSLLPWFLMYGVSSLPFAHRAWFDALYDDGVPTWKLRSETPYDAPVPADTELKQLGAQIMRHTGLKGSFGTYRPNPQEVHVYVYTFWTSTQVKYLLDKKLLRVEDRRFRWDQFLTGMHARGGFEDRRPLVLGWSVVVDLVCIGFILWIATGIYMWWNLPQARGWGWIALGTGAAVFVLFLVGL
ncbi:MAG: hypothetical protein ACR2L2_19745 [Acidobacteriota bacterium]